MSLIQHLSEQVTPFLKSQIADTIGSANIATDSLLEQFYAIFSTRLSDPVLLSQLSPIDSSTGMPTKNLFVQVWTNQDQRDNIINELAEGYHINPNIVQQLVHQASDNIFQKITQLASEQQLSIFDYLQTELEVMRAYLPTWVATVIPLHVLKGETNFSSNLKPSISEEIESLNTDTNIQTSQKPLHSSVQSSIDQNQYIGNTNNHNNVTKRNDASPIPPRKMPRPTNVNKTNIHKQKKSSRLPMLLLPIFAVGLLISGGWFWLNGQKTAINANATIENSSTETILESESQPHQQPPQNNLKTDAKLPKKAPVNNNSNKQSISFDANALNSQANGGALSNSTIEGEGQAIVGVENLGPEESIVYDFEPKNQGMDPNSLESLANSTIGSDSTQSSQGQPSLTNTPNSPSNIPNIEPSTIGVEPSSTIGVEPTLEENTDGTDRSSTESLPESSQKSAPRKTYSPITGKTVIITGRDI